MGMVLLVVLTLAVAFANGANDVSKGIATLVGSGVTNLRRAILWGTAWTVAGGSIAAFASRELVAVFSGQGILVPAASSPLFLIAIACAVIGWLGIATKTGLPVSTTHALVGGLVGAGIAAQGVGGVRWAAVATKTALPLAVSPVLALALTIAVFPLIRLVFRRPNRYRVSLERDEPVVPVAGSDASVAPGPSGPIIAGAERPHKLIARANVMDSLHWLSSGSTSFFRGLNDTPKILSLGVVAAGTIGIAALWFFVLVAVAMGAGSYLAGRQVTETLACKVTRIAHDDGFTANLVTSALVGAASMFALPVSTTHISSGAITGVGLRKQDLRWKLVRDIVLAWIVTLPVTAVVAAGVYTVLGLTFSSK